MGHLIFKKSLIIFEIFLPLLGLLGSLIFLSNLFKISSMDLPAIIENFGLDTQKQVMLSEEKVSPEMLSFIYNSVDCTINISDAEGFGLATLESLACETPIIVNMTGGMQEQVTDGEQWFGVGLEPTSKAIIGSQ